MVEARAAARPREGREGATDKVGQAERKHHGAPVGVGALG